jgi:hypothetical protein
MRICIKKNIILWSFLNKKLNFLELTKHLKYYNFFQYHLWLINVVKADILNDIRNKLSDSQRKKN